MTDFTGSNTPAEHRDSWRTPPEIFAALNAEFDFQLDAAANEKKPTMSAFYLTGAEHINHFMA